MNRELLREQADAYVLGVLEGEDRAALERQAASAEGAAVRAQLRESEEAIALLAFTAPQVDPPALLRSRLLNQVRLMAPPVPVARPVSMVWKLGWAVAAGLAVLALLGWQALRTGEAKTAAARAELNAARAEIAALSSDVQKSRRVMAVLMSRDARFIRLSTAGQEPLFRAFWSGPGGLVLAGWNVPPPAAGRTFQLWVVPRKGNPISAGLLAREADGSVLLIADSVARPDEAAALAISDEPAGGSAQPTTKPAYVGALGD